MALTDALDEMVTARELTPTIAMRILLEFDRCVVKELGTRTTQTKNYFWTNYSRINIAK